MAIFRLASTATLLAASACLPVWAESQVAVYGSIDLGINKESGTSAKMGRGSHNIIGIKGQENLGNGRAAIFNLQAFFNHSHEPSGLLQPALQGESTVGLQSRDAGTVRLGRALSPLWQNIWLFEPWKNSGYNASLHAYQTGRYSSDGVNDAAFGSSDFSRISNGVFYRSPELSGLTLELASRVNKAENARERPRGFSLRYDQGPVGALVSYENNNNDDKIHFVGGSYQINALTLMASYASNRVRNTEREQTAVLAGTYAAGAHLLRAGHGRNRLTDSHKSSLGYVHNLSPRTSLYADLYRERLTPASTNGMALGLIHTF